MSQAVKQTETVIELITPDDEPAPMKVRLLGGDRYLCMQSNEFGSSYRLLAGDTFHANRLSENIYLFRDVEQPSAMLHFRVNLGWYLMDPSLADQPKSARDSAFAGLEDSLQQQYVTPALIEFLKAAKGGWEMDELIQCFTLFIHVPATHRETLMARIDELCPGLKLSELEEIASGVDEW